MPRPYLTDLTLMYVRETDAALCVRLDDEHDVVWLPKSQIEWEYAERGTPKGRRLVVVTLPEDLAVEKDLA